MAMMISKFHKIIQSKVVWTVFAILISVAFVGVYTGSRTGSAKQRQQLEDQVAGKLYGEDVTRIEFGTSYRSVYLMYSMAYMSTGRQLEIDDEVDKMIREEAWKRLATLKKARQMGLTATTEQIVEMIKLQPVFMNQQTGQYDAQNYNAFLSGYLPRFGLNSAIFEQIMAENVVIEKASSIASQGALVTEDEIKTAFHLYNDKTTVDYATIPRSLIGTIEVTEEDAKVYFAANKEEFRYPEKAIVKYVAFNVADYTNAVAVTDEMVAQAYEANKERFIKPETATNAVPEYKALEEVKGEIVEAMTLSIGNQEAFNAADSMVAQLSDTSVTFEQAAAKAEREIVSNMPAFAATDTIEGVDPTAPFVRMAFSLQSDATHYYSDPVRGRDSIYVISLVKRLPEWDPSFDVVKADVIESAKIAASEKAYVEKAESVHAEIEKALKAGTSFADAAAPFNLELKQTIPFNSITPLEDEFGNEIMSATVGFGTGTLVDLISTPDEFLIAYIAGKETADEATTLPAMAMREELADSIRSEKAGQLARAWRDSLLKEAEFVNLMDQEAASDDSESDL